MSNLKRNIQSKSGVKVVSAKESISDGPEGIILESMLKGYAEYYSAEPAQKVYTRYDRKRVESEV